MQKKLTPKSIDALRVHILVHREVLKLERKITRLAPEQNKLLAVAEDWHSFVGHSRQTWRKHTEKLKRFVLVVGDLPIDQITREEMERYRDSLVTPWGTANGWGLPL